MRRAGGWGALALALALVALFPAAGGAAGLPGLLTGTGSKTPFAVRPAAIYYTGDSTGVLGGFDGNGRYPNYGHLNWSSWTQTAALGSGAVWLDNCTPNCAQGTFSPYAVTVEATAPEAGHFTRLTLHYAFQGNQVTDIRGVEKSGSFYTYVTVGFVVTPSSPPSPPADTKCEDLVTISPSLGDQAERVLWHLPSFASKDLPLAVKASAQLGGVGVCQAGLSSLTPEVDSSSSPQFLLNAAYAASRPRFAFGFQPLGWTIPQDTGAPSGQLLMPTLDWSHAIEFSAGPELDFTYSASKGFESDLSMIRVSAFPLKVTLVARGAAYLDATVGPQLSLDLGVDTKALAMKVAERVAQGEDPQAAADEVAQEADQEVQAAVDGDVAATDPLAASTDAFTADVATTGDQILASLEAELPAEASTFIVVVTDSEVGVGAIDLVAPVAEDVGGASLLDLLALLLLTPDHRGAAVHQRVPQVAIAPSSGGSVPRSTVLAAAPVGRLSRRSLRRAPFPRRLVASLIRRTFTLATRARVGPLVVTQTHLRAGNEFTIIAPGLRRGRRHAAELVVAGPGYRAARLLAVSRGGVAGATFRVPRPLRPGTWVIAVRDISGVGAKRNGRLTGITVIRAGVFTVPAPRGNGRHRPHRR